MTALRLLALDLSLTATGFAGLDEDGRVLLRTRRTGPLDGHERLQDLCVGVANACRHIAPHLVIIEDAIVGYGNNVLKLAELHGLVKQQLWITGIPYVLVAPKTRAVYACGNGNAPKLAVQDAVEARYGRVCGDDNEADALCLLGMAADQYGHPFGQPVLDKCRRALASVRWPTLNLPEDPSPRHGVALQPPTPGGAGTPQPIHS